MPEQKLGYKHLSAWVLVITLGWDFLPLLISCAA